MAFLAYPDHPHWRPHQNRPVLIRNHPIARNLFFAYVSYEGKGEYLYDRVRPQLHGSAELGLADAGTPKWVQTDLGSAIQVDNTTHNQRPNWPAANNYVQTVTDWSFEMIVRLDSTQEGNYFTAFGANFSGGTTASNDPENLPAWYLEIIYASGAGGRTWGRRGSGADPPLFLHIPAVGAWVQYIMTHSGSSCPSLYVNGLNVDATVKASSDTCVGGSVAGGDIIVFAGQFGSKPQRTFCSMRFWDRAIRADEINALAYDPWVIYEEAASYRRFSARYAAAVEPQSITGAGLVDGDAVASGGGTISIFNQLIAGAIVDGDAVAAGPGGQILGEGLIEGAGLIDGDAVGGNGGLFFVQAQLSTPSVDIGAAREEVFVQVRVEGGATFVIECSEDDENFHAVTAELDANTIYHCDQRIPYWRVRKGNTFGNLISIWGPQELRVEGHEKGVVSPRIRYSNQDMRKSH